MADGSPSSKACGPGQPRRAWFFCVAGAELARSETDTPTAPRAAKKSALREKKKKKTTMDQLMSLQDVEDVALKPMLQMAEDCSSSSNISTIRTLIMKVLTDPQIHAGFDQIKEKLKGSLSSGSDGEVLLRTLDLFSFGMFKDYQNAAGGQYLSLTDAQVFKLRQLTALSVVQKSCLSPEQSGSVSYDVLKKELDLDEEVEDLIISCIYARIFVGKLCQKTRRLIVSSEDSLPCRSRDVPPSETGNLLAAIKDLSQRLQNTMTQLETSKATVQSGKDASENFWKQVEQSKQSKAAGDGWGAVSSSGSYRRNETGRAARSGKRSRGGFAGDSRT